MAAHDEPRAQAASPAQPAGEWRWLRTDTILLAIAAGVLLWLTGPVLLMVFAGVLLAVALDALGAALTRHTPLSRGWAVVVVVVVLTLLLIAGAVVIFPRFMVQLGQIWEQLAALVEQAQQTLQQYPWMQEALRPDEQGAPGGGTMGVVGDVVAQVAAATMTVFGVLTNLIVIVIIGLFLAANPALYRRGLVKLVPVNHRPRAEETLSTVGYALRWWLLGQLASMLMLGVSTSLALLVLGVELWLGLGVLTALLTFIPFLGPIIAGVPVVLIGFAQGLQTGLLVLAVYLVLQNVEGNILTPLIQQRAIHLPPALLIGMQVLLGVLFGVAGLILAAPLTVVGMVAVNLLYIEDVLGDRRATP